MIHNIIIANDHAAVDAKLQLIKYLESKQYNVINVGTNSSQRTHYPEYAVKAAQLLTTMPQSRAILICGTGVGITLAANRIKGVRGMICSTALTAQQAREMFDINTLGLGARTLGIGMMETIVDVFLNTQFNVENLSKKNFIDRS